MRELDLCKILKGHENELFYSPIFGKVYLNAILTQGQPYPINLITEKEKEIYVNCNGFWDNKHTENTITVLYPSQKAYLKYPFDAKKAWQEWIDEQYNLEIKYQIIGGNQSTCGQLCTFKFTSAEEARKAIETVKTILEQLSQKQ